MSQTSVMNNRLANPALVAVIGLLLGVVCGPAWFLLRADDLVTDAIVARRLFLAQKEQQQRTQGWNFWTIEIDNLTADLKAEKERLNKETDQLVQREARLSAEKLELEKLRSEIESMRSDLDSRVVSISADESKNLKALSKTYETLTAQQAVAIFKQMDDTTAVKILSLMKPDVAGPIFGEMATESATDPSLARRAAQLSDKMRLMKSGVQSSDAQSPDAQPAN